MRNKIRKNIMYKKILLLLSFFFIFINISFANIFKNKYLEKKYIESIQGDRKAFEYLKKQIGKEKKNTPLIEIIGRTYNKHYPEEIGEYYEILKENNLWEILLSHLEWNCRGQILHNIPFNADYCVTLTKEAMKNGSIRAHNFWDTFASRGFVWNNIIYVRPDENRKTLNKKTHELIIKKSKNGEIFAKRLYAKYLERNLHHGKWRTWEEKEKIEMSTEEKKEMFNKYLDLLKDLSNKENDLSTRDLIDLYYKGCKKHACGFEFKKDPDKAKELKTKLFKKHYSENKMYFDKSRMEYYFAVRDRRLLEDIFDFYVNGREVFEENFEYKIMQNITGVFLGSGYWGKKYIEFSDKIKIPNDYINFLKTKLPKSDDDFVNLIEEIAMFNDIGVRRRSILRFNDLLFWIYSGEKKEDYSNIRNYYEPPFAELDKFKIKKEKNYKKALKRYLNAGPLYYKDNPRIAFFIARAFKEGLYGLEKSQRKARNIYNSILPDTASENYDDACYGNTNVDRVANYHIAEMYLQNNNLNDALRYFERVNYSIIFTNQQYGGKFSSISRIFQAQSAYIVGNELLKKNKYEQAVKWFAIGADKGHPIAQYLLAKEINDGHNPFTKKGKINWNNKMHSYFWASIASQYIEDFTFIKPSDFFKRSKIKFDIIKFKNSIRSELKEEEKNEVNKVINESKEHFNIFYGTAKPLEKRGTYTGFYEGAGGYWYYLHYITDKFSLPLYKCDPAGFNKYQN